MKKFITGLLAIALAIGGLAFTHKSTKKPDTTFYYFTVTNTVTSCSLATLQQYTDINTMPPTSQSCDDAGVHCCVVGYSTVTYTGGKWVGSGSTDLHTKD